MPLRRTVLLAALVAGTRAGAQVVTVGTPTSPAIGNAFPFNHFNLFGHNRYQQVYRGGAFGPTGGPINITSLRFFDTNDPGSTIAPGSYVVRLSTTARAVNGLSPDFDANLGGDVQTFFGGSLGGTLTIAGAIPFVYDPGRGNLLLDVFVSGQTSNGRGLQTAEPGSDVSRAFGTDGRPAMLNAAGGLLTQFAFTAVPEPGTWALFGTGLAGVAGAVAWRRRAPVS